MQKDITEKRLEDCNDVFADIFNSLVFDGEQILNPDELVSLPTESFTRKRNGKFRQGNRDVRKADKRKGRYRLICGAENQTGLDYTMPERIMGYDYSSYEEQVKYLKEKNRKDGNPAYAKQIHESQKLAPVMTVVLYWGEEEWKSPLCLHDMLEFPSEAEEKLRSLIPDYPIHVIQMNRLSEESRKRLTSDFRLIADYIACQNEPERLRKWAQNREVKIQHPEECLDALRAISNDKKFEEVKKRIQERSEKEEFSMYSVFDAVEDGGIAKGIAKGIETGIKQGEYKKLISLICKKLCKGKEASVIAEELEEEEDKIREICEIAKKYAPEYDSDKIYNELKELSGKKLKKQLTDSALVFYAQNNASAITNL